MCGRFQMAIELDMILEKYGIINSNIDFTPQNEIFPSDMSLAIINSDGKREVTMLKWGFTVPFTKKLLINARSETASIKPTFREAFIYRRGLIPVSGYYEWKKENDKKIKYRIYSEDGVFSLACIYKSFTDNTGNNLDEYTILTRPAYKAIQDIHDRMPVIIDRKYEDIWIDNNIKDVSLLNKIIASSYRRLLWERV